MPPWKYLQAARDFTEPVVVRLQNRQRDVTYEQDIGRRQRECGSYDCDAQAAEAGRDGARV